MIVFAQAAAEYGGIAPRGGSSGSLDQALDRLANASTGEYLVLGLGLLIGFIVLMKLLDAA